MLERGLGQLGRGAMSAYQGGTAVGTTAGENRIRRGPHGLAGGAGGNGKAVAPADPLEGSSNYRRSLGSQPWEGCLNPGSEGNHLGIEDTKSRAPGSTCI